QQGVVAGSLGNHGQAVAPSAQMLGSTAVVVRPCDVQTVKRDAVLRPGGQVVACDPSTEDRDAIVACIAAEQDRVVSFSYDNPEVIANAATVAIEILEDAGPLDFLLGPVSGCGLAAGCAVAARTFCPTARVGGVEPVGAGDTRRSRVADRRVHIASPTT